MVSVFNRALVKGACLQCKLLHPFQPCQLLGSCDAAHKRSYAFSSGVGLFDFFSDFIFGIQQYLQVSDEDFHQ